MATTEGPTIDDTADELAALLGIDPEKVMVSRSDNCVTLSHAAARRLLVAARQENK